MSEHDSRERSDRKGSLLSLVPTRETGEGDAVASGPAATRAAEAADRHRRARALREAVRAQQGSGAGAQGAGERGGQEPFAEQERELQALLAARPGSDHPPADVSGHAHDGDDSPVAPAAPPRRQTVEPAWAAVPARASAASDEDPYWRPLIDPMKVIGGVIRSRWIIAATTVAGAAIAAAIALSTPKLYVAVTELIVDPRQLRITQNELTDGGLSTEATLAIVENQVRVLRSGNVLGKVVDTLGLDKDPEFNGTRGGGIGSVVSTLRSLLSSGNETGDPSVRRRALAIEHLSDATDVERGGKTFVVTVAAKTESADKSALIANTLTEVFLEAYGSIQAGSAGRASDELTSRLSELRAGVEEAERNVETFKAQNDIVDAQGRLITDDEIVKLNDQLSTARARTFELQARADSTRNLTVDAVLAGNLPEQMNSPVLTEMRTQYSLLRQEADRAAARLGPRHPERLAIEAQVDAARQRVEQELRLVASSIQVELRRAVQLEQELAARLAQLKARQAGLSGELVTLRELEREAAAKRAVYEAFLLRARETGEQKDLNTANVSVISKATPPLEPSGPSRTMRTLLGAFLGLGVGVMFGAARGTLDSLRDDSRGGRPGGAPRIPAAALAAGGRGRRPEAPEDDMQPASRDAPERDGTPVQVRARNEAQDDTTIDRTAGKAEEADMYHVRPQMAWTPAGAPDQDRDQAGYAPSARDQRQWADQGYQGGAHAPDPQAPWMMQQPDLQQHRHPLAPQQAPMGYYAPAPQAPAGFAPGYPGYPAYPQMQPQAYGYPQQPHPMGYGYQPAQPAMAQENARYYAPQPAPAAWQAPMQRAAEPAYQPVQAPAMPQRQSQPAQAGWPQPARADAAQAREQAAPAASTPAATADSSAIEEIRESLREFRQALRELAETRSRRRFL